MEIQAVKLPNALWKTHASPLSAAEKIMTAPVDDIGEVGNNVKVPGELVYNPGCLALARQQRYVVWPVPPALHHRSPGRSWR
jgi:hypothetical protein